MVAAIMRSTAPCVSPLLCRISSSWMGSSTVMYLLKMSTAEAASGRSILIFTSRRPGRRVAWWAGAWRLEAAGAGEGRVDGVLAVGGADDDDVLQVLHAVDLGQQLRHDRRLHVGGDARPAGAEQGVHLVEEH